MPFFSARDWERAGLSGAHAEALFAWVAESESSYPIPEHPLMVRFRWIREHRQQSAEQVYAPAVGRVTFYSGPANLVLGEEQYAERRSINGFFLIEDQFGDNLIVKTKLGDRYRIIL
jgi:hypothetical protein